MWTLQSCNFLPNYFSFKLAPIWLELAEELEGIDNLIIAKMDATANEVDGL